ncbi:glycine receptor subunit alpha-3-like [Acanthaster planci]|uniref:Gamma-aminobutyric acid receptor subunit beta n=1 Tax=Acanthaster planci TaxID=133434 RepID=A0A8B7ZI03_ACAPL|nr:glycine receptor subunit alpha-3-like [Acanthaster planci]
MTTKSWRFRPTRSCGVQPCIVLLLTVAASISLASASMNVTAVLDSILRGYDNRVRPDGVAENSAGLQEPDENLPLRILVQIYIESVDGIRESTMDWTATVYLRLFWQDRRLAFHGNRSLALQSKGIERIWLPDIYFLNEKNARVHMVTQPNKLMRVQPNGKVSYSQRITLTVSCNMNLQKFPMDSQDCDIIISTYAYSTEDVLLYVDDHSIQIEPAVTISKFSLTGMEAKQETLEFSLGNFSSVRCYFHFIRQMESYFLTVYIPTLLLVSIAWLSFWIDAKAAPARVALGITTVLTVTTMTAGIQETLPVVTYAKAIDIWLVVCLMFVFFSLLEYGVANFLLIKQANKAAFTASIDDRSKRNRTLEGGPQESSQGQLMTADRMDRYARWLYPIAFLTFSVCYWIIFLTM